MGPLVRVGGNSQEASTLYTQGFANNMIIEKVKVDGVGDNRVFHPNSSDLLSILLQTVTPTINYSPDIFYMMANVSNIVDAHWFFGLSFNQSAVETQSPNVPLVAQTAQQMLGYHLLGLQLSNEPDLSVAGCEGFPPDTYCPWRTGIPIITSVRLAGPFKITQPSSTKSRPRSSRTRHWKTNNFSSVHLSAVTR